MLMILSGMFVALSICFLLLRFNHLHANVSNDYSDAGPQKFHAQPTPRVGGIAIASGLFFSYLYYRMSHHDPEVTLQLGYLLIAVIPAFAGGLSEDFTRRVSISTRLILAVFSAVIGLWLLDAVVIRLDVAPLDWLLHLPLIATLFTFFAVAGVVNAINIIDGFNGIVGFFGCFMLLAIAYVAFKLNDTFLVNAALALLGSLLGFLYWNYPHGKIFLGDGGSYLVGFWLAELVVLIVARHPQVSPWFAVLLLIHPVFETFFSVYRRKVLRGKSPWYPDGLHLHSLIFRRLNHRQWASKSFRHKTRCNSMTAPYFCVIKSATALLAVLYWNNSPALIISTLLFVIFYVWIYWRIVKFKTPCWLVKHDRRRFQARNREATALNESRERRSVMGLAGLRQFSGLFRLIRRDAGSVNIIYQKTGLSIPNDTGLSPNNEHA